MQHRIKQLIAKARQPDEPIAIPAISVQKISYTKELELAIKADVLARRCFTYEQAAERIGCSTEKMRLLAQGYPICRAGRTHRIPECVLKLIIRDSTT